MAGSSNELHEDGLSEATIDRHRAIVSLMEELEAVDWYDQRIEGTNDASLAAILVHNRDEEKEHAAIRASLKPPAAGSSCSITCARSPTVRSSGRHRSTERS